MQPIEDDSENEDDLAMDELEEENIEFASDDQDDSDEGAQITQYLKKDKKVAKKSERRKG